MNAFEAALFARLSGDATLLALLGGSAKIYRGLAPSAAAVPYVVFAKRAGETAHTLTQVAGREMLYRVAARDDGLSGAAAAAIADRVDTLLTGTALTVSGWSSVKVRRAADVDEIRSTNGLVEQEVGAVYLVELAA